MHTELMHRSLDWSLGHQLSSHAEFWEPTVTITATHVYKLSHIQNFMMYRYPHGFIDVYMDALGSVQQIA
jgi:hypothetical protein